MTSRIILLCIALFSASVAFAQKDSTATKNKPAKSENEVKVEQSISIIKKEIDNIKKNIDTAKLREMAKQLGKSAEEIGDALEDMADDIEDKADEAEKKMEKSKPSNDDKTIGVIQDEKGNVKIKTNVKVTRRTKMYFDFSIGLSGMVDNISSPVTDRFYPEAKTWGSRYWDIGLKFKTRIGGTNSKASITYGLSYLLNSLEFANDAKIEMTNGAPKFVKVDNATNSTELNIGYLTIPIGLEFKVGKKGKLGVGGYAGYRIRSVQNIDYKNDTERIEESRKANYGLNNIMYGASAKIGVGGLVLTGRYNLSTLFKDTNKDYQYNLYNLGLSFGF